MRNTFKYLSLTILIVANIAFAQRPDRHDESDDCPGRPPGRREQIEELRIWKMTTFLDLSTEQAQKFFPALKEHEKRVFKLMKKQHDYMHEITQKSVEEGFQPTEKDIDKIFEQWEKYDDKIKAEKKNFVNNELGFLTNQQRVKYIVFDSRFKSHLLRALKEHNKRK